MRRRDESQKGSLSGSPLAGDIRAGEHMAVGRTHDVVERLRPVLPLVIFLVPTLRSVNQLDCRTVQLDPRDYYRRD